MIPTSISATALQTAEECLAKYKALYIDRAQGFNNSAALLGTTLHETLQRFLDPKFSPVYGWDFDMLLNIFGGYFDKNFGRVEREEDSIYQDGVRILTNWFHRGGQYSDVRKGQILSQEIKSEFKVPYLLDGIKQFVPFRYIIDRLDKLDNETYRVVDYKSQRSPLNAEDMRKHIQVRGYGLAVQIMYPDAKEIQVQLDFLRYNSVTVFLNRRDHEKTWEYLKLQLQRIVDTDGNFAPETLGKGCQYCVRKFTCQSAMSNINVGGILALDLDDLADLLERSRAQQKLAGDIVAQTEQLIFAQLKHDDEANYFGEKYEITRGVSSRRDLDKDKLTQILGRELYTRLLEEMGKLTLGDFDKLKKDDRLTDEQKSLLSTAISTKVGGEKLTITAKKEELA